MDQQRQQQQQDPPGGAPYAGAVADDDVNDNFNNILLKAKQIASRLAQDRAASAHMNPLPAQPETRPTGFSGPSFSNTESSDVPLPRDSSVLRGGSTVSYAAGGRDSGNWPRSKSPRGRSRSPQRGPARDDNRRYNRPPSPTAYRQRNEGASTNLPYDYPENPPLYHSTFSSSPGDSIGTTISFTIPDHAADILAGSLKSISGRSGTRIQLQAQSDNEDGRLVTVTGIRSAIDKARELIDQTVGGARKNNRVGDYTHQNPRNSPLPNANHAPPYYPAGAPTLPNIPPMGGLRPQQPPFQLSPMAPPREHSTEDYNPVTGEMIIHVPNNKVGVIIGRGGDMIRDLQERSGARIAVTPDNEADRSSDKRMVRFYGSLVNCRRAKGLIDELVVTLPSRAGTSDSAKRFDPPPQRTFSAPSAVPQVLPPQPAAAHSFTELIYIPAETAGLVIGRGGETVRCLENASGAKITMENGEVVNGKRPVKVIGTADQIAHAKDLIIRKVEEDNKFRANKPRPVVPQDHNIPLDHGYARQTSAVPPRQDYVGSDGAGSYGAPDMRSQWQPTAEREQHLQQYSTPYDRPPIAPPAATPYNPAPPFRDAYGAQPLATSTIPPLAGPPPSNVPAYNGGGYVPQGAPSYRQQPTYGAGASPNVNAAMSGATGSMMGYGNRHVHDEPYRREEKRGEYYDRDAGYSPYDGGGMHQQQHHLQQPPPPPQQHQNALPPSFGAYGPDPSHQLPASGVPAPSSDYASYYSRWYASQNNVGSDGRNGGSASAGGAPYGGRPGGENRGGMY